MKILFVTENFPPETNAAATRVFERACYWVAAGHAVSVITTSPNFPQGEPYDGYGNPWHRVDTVSGMRVVRVKSFMAQNRGVVLRSLDFLSFMVTGFGAGVFEERPDVIAATSPQFFSAVAGWALAAVRRVPFVFELGDLWPASIAEVGAMRDNAALRLLERLELFLYRRSAAVVALTVSFKENLVSRGIDGSKIAVVLNGVDLPRYAPRARHAGLAAEWGLEGRFVVGYVGTHGMAHGLGNVLDAAERLADDDRVRFLLVGAGAERDALIAEARRRRLANVVFMAHQAKERMPEVWSLCDVALVHLRNAPVFAGVIPSKIFEAMGSGLPILLAAPAGEAARIVEGHGAGIAVPPEDPDALAGAVGRLAGDAGLCRSLAERSLAAAPRHSRQQQAEDVIRVFDAVLAGRPAAPPA